ncbi:hypothetical protein FA95DRAFT_766963 [Auriscalpium vulgare]|uniref:Uncharacterized protein n=1 Tax=Auriscalpium vulgare TaxID=40419 RepID=A0ACB8RC84_9AGAM|nr:hypothetical protein FA95DRAFT_766963 [Auriscalpium vulgare]
MNFVWNAPTCGGTSTRQSYVKHWQLPGRPLLPSHPCRRPSRGTSHHASSSHASQFCDNAPPAANVFAPCSPGSSPTALYCPEHLHQLKVDRQWPLYASFYTTARSAHELRWSEIFSGNSPLQTHGGDNLMPSRAYLFPLVLLGARGLPASPVLYNIRAVEYRYPVTWSRLRTSHLIIAAPHQAASACSLVTE